MAKVNEYPRLLRTIGTLTFIMSLVATANGVVASFFKKLLEHYSCTVEIKERDYKLALALKQFIKNDIVWKKSIKSKSVAKAPAQLPLSARGRKLQNSDPSRDIKYEDDGGSYIWYNWRLFKIAETGFGGRLNFDISTLGFSKKPIEQLLDDAWAVYHDMTLKSAVEIYKNHGFGGDAWGLFHSNDIRPLSTIDFDPLQKANLIKDIEKFLDPEKQASYKRRGIPYRRGYLFHSPPGTGKSSLSFAIAGHLGLSVMICTLNEPNMSDSRFATLMQHVPKPSLILLEDIDSTGIKREGDVYSKDGITLSGILNALDGITALDGCIVIMTTNHPEVLDPALTRPGRIDYKVAFQNATRSVARTCFVRMLEPEPGSDTDKLADEFADVVPEYMFSPAELQGYLQRYVECPLDVVRDFHTFKHDTLLERAQRAEADTKKAEAKELERLARFQRKRKDEAKLNKVVERTKRREAKQAVKEKADKEAEQAPASSTTGLNSSNAEVTLEADSVSDASSSHVSSKSSSVSSFSSSQDAENASEEEAIKRATKINWRVQPVVDGFYDQQF